MDTYRPSSYKNTKLGNANARNSQDIRGDYQFNALHNGPISQRLWHKQKIEVIRSHLQGKKYIHICDAGCGSGVVADFVAATLPKSTVVGYDINYQCIKFALNKFKKDNLVFYVKDLIRIDPNRIYKFDFIYSMEVIEHFSPDDLQLYISFLHNMGNPKAQYFITTPDYASLWPLVEWTLDLLRLTPKMAGHQHLTKLTKTRLSFALERGGFEVLKINSFCGMAPFFGHMSKKVYRFVDKIEKKFGYGNLIACEFRKKL